MSIVARKWSERKCHDVRYGCSFSDRSTDSRQRDTPLDYASLNGRKACTQLLCENGGKTTEDIANIHTEQEEKVVS
jgi:hypothetical protein